MLRFNTILESEGVDPAGVRLVRHRHGPVYQRAVYLDAIRGEPRFEIYQASQANPRVIAQMRAAAAIASFVVDPAAETVFVGLWSVNGVRNSHVSDPYKPSAPPRSGSVFDFRPMKELATYRGRIVVDWGGGERAWVQHARRRDKSIIELRRRAEEPQFPGFPRLACGLHEIESMPATWKEALRVTRGVYLVVHRESGAQYVGSATGADGFLGRWRAYADGHGGNVRLRELAHPCDQYDVRVLETVGSTASRDEIYEIESVWKDKLGSRVQGLNRN